MQIKLITDDRELALGSRLSGIQTREVDENTVLSDEWKMAVEDKDLGVLYLSKNVAEALQEEIDAFRAKHHQPIVVVLPEQEES